MPTQRSHTARLRARNVLRGRTSAARRPCAAGTESGRAARRAAAARASSAASAARTWGPGAGLGPWARLGWWWRGALRSKIGDLESATRRRFVIRRPCPPRVRARRRLGASRARQRASGDYAAPSLRVGCYAWSSKSNINFCFPRTFARVFKCAYHSGLPAPNPACQISSKGPSCFSRLLSSSRIQACVKESASYRFLLASFLMYMEFIMGLILIMESNHD